MEKKKRTLVPLIAIALLVIILVIPLIRGIVNRNNFPVQHEKEIKKWREIVKKSCDFGEWEEKKVFSHYEGDWDLKNGTKPEAKTKIIYCQGDYCNDQPFRQPQQDKCMADRITLSNIKDEYPPSIFCYYKKIILQITQHFTIFMFLTLLIISSFILIEIYNIKKQK